jgi:PAS domain S-box-containing protein
MKSLLRILIVEDSEEDTQLLLRHLESSGYEIAHERVETANSLSSALDQGSWDLVFCDFTMPHFSGLAALEIVKKRSFDLPFIFVSGTLGEDAAVEAMKAGADDYVMKNHLARLVPAMEREFREANLRRQHRQAAGVVGESNAALERRVEGLIAALNELEVSEQNLRETNDFLESVVENIPIMVFVKETVDLRFIRMNKAGQRLLGFSQEEVLGKSAFDIFPNEEANFFTCSDRKALKGHQMQLIEEQSIHTKVGESKILRTRKIPLLGRDGTPQYLLGISEDITERKRVEEALRQSEERFRLLVEGVEDYAIFMLSPQGRVVSWNKGAERIKGYKFDEIIGNHFSCFYPPEAIAQGKPERELRTAVEEGHMHDEGWRVRKDGQHFWASVVITALFDVNGCLQGFAKITRDMSERERIERALYEKNVELAEARTKEVEERSAQAETKSQRRLRASELSYRRLFEAAKDGILILDADTGRITDANPSLVELLGYSLREMLGKTVGELSPFKDIQPNREMLERLQQYGYVRYEDLPLETADHRHIAVEFVSNVYQAGDKRVIQCDIRDITARKRSEDEIRDYNAELEERVAERTAQLEAFSYSVSHDLRAPLRHVIGFLDLLQRDAGQSLSEESLRHIKTISRSAKRMGELIGDLLAFSKLGRSMMQKTEVNLNELILDTLSDFQPETNKRDIEWNIHPLPTVLADRALLRLVLVNLISNAVKFTSVRPVARIEIGCAPSGSDETVIFIRDNGAGFDSRYSKKLFGVFQRLHSQNEFEGTGIGLANVRRIIDRHGGRAWAEGVVDAGATLYFSIPKRNREIISK